MPNVGRKGKGNHTQSVVFNKKAGWTEAKSKAWTPLDLPAEVLMTLPLITANDTLAILKDQKNLKDFESLIDFCKANGYKTDGHDENTTQHRWRQVDPENGKFRYRTKIIETKKGTWSIMLVLGFPKRSPVPKKK